MNPEITIRPAERHDTAALGRLINAIQREEFAIPITLAEQPDLADIEGAYRKGAGEFWVAEAGNLSAHGRGHAVLRHRALALLISLASGERALEEVP